MLARRLGPVSLCALLAEIASERCEGDRDGGSQVVEHDD